MAGTPKNYKEDPDFREYVRWEALPRWKKKEEGVPETQQEWCEKYGYSPRGVQKWKKKDAYDELMGEITQQWLDDSIPKVVATAKEVAQTPDESGHKDRKFLAKLAGMGGAEMTIRHEGEVDHNHTLEEVRTMDESALREAMRVELRKNPRFAEATDEELDEMIGAFVGANTGGGAAPALPGEAPQKAEKSADYVLAEPPSDLSDEDS